MLRMSTEKNTHTHNVYDNVIKPSQFKERLNNTLKTDINLFSSTLYEILEDCKADLANQKLNQSETKSHYRKYLDIAKSMMSSISNNQAKMYLNHFVQNMTALV